MEKLKPIKLSIKIDKNAYLSFQKQHSEKSSCSDDSDAAKSHVDSNTTTRAKTKGDIKKQLMQRKRVAKSNRPVVNDDDDSEDEDESEEDDVSEDVSDIVAKQVKATDCEVAKQTIEKRKELLKVCRVVDIPVFDL